MGADSQTDRIRNVRSIDNNLLAVNTAERRLLLMVAGDVELNPGPRVKGAPGASCKRQSLTGKGCTVPGCSNRRETAPKLSFFHFPLDKAHIWAMAINRPDLAQLTPELLHRRCVVCGKHFETPSFLNDLQNRLQPSAVPVITPARHTPAVDSHSVMKIEDDNEEYEQRDEQTIDSFAVDIDDKKVDSCDGNGYYFIQTTMHQQQTYAAPDSTRAMIMVDCSTQCSTRSVDKAVQTRSSKEDGLRRKLHAARVRLRRQEKTIFLLRDKCRKLRSQHFSNATQVEYDLT